MMASRNWLRRFRQDQSGVSAVEFALLAPIMIALYFGMVEVCQAYMAQKRMSHVTSMVADLTAQAQSVTRNDLTDIFNIGNQIMEPFSPTPLQTRPARPAAASAQASRPKVGLRSPLGKGAIGPAVVGGCLGGGPGRSLAARSDRQVDRAAPHQRVIK